VEFIDRTLPPDRRLRSMKSHTWSAVARRIITRGLSRCRRC